MVKYSLGFDFGTESCRVIIVDIRDGRIAWIAEHYNALVVQEKLVPLMAQPGIA